MIRSARKGEEEQFFDDLQTQYNTEKILETALSEGCFLIGIGAMDQRFEAFKGWPFGTRDSIFCNGKGKDCWPLAWTIGRRLWGNQAGNGGQYQMDEDNVDYGIWEYDGQQWNKVPPISGST
jgi:hypothetical protein